MPNTANLKAVFTSIDGKKGFFVLKENTLLHAHFCLEHHLAVGTIVMGHMENKVANLDAGFVSYQKGTKGFLKKCHGYKGHDVFPVQITKDPVKTKEAELCLDFQMKGLYAVLKKKPGGLFLSKKIAKDKAVVIKDYLQDVLRDEYTLIVRSNVLSLFPNELDILKNDILHLYENMDGVLAKATSRSEYSVLYAGNNFCLEQISDLDFTRLEEVITDDSACYDLLKTKLPKMIRDKVCLYSETQLPLYALYGLRGALSDAIQRRVWLKSGGYLIVEQTEAMLVIDVNSGKNNAKISKEQMIEQTNKEACAKVASLISLLNSSGMILIDFLNYPDKCREDKESKLLHYMKELVEDDVKDVNVVDITPLGIMEMTRDKKQMTLVEQLKEVGLYEAIKSI